MSDQRSAVNKAKAKSEDTDLAGSQMAETADEFLPVKGICGHLHPAHEGHFLVHIHQHILVDLDIQRRDFGLVPVESVLMKSNGERLGVGRSLCWLSAVRYRLEGTC